MAASLLVQIHLKLLFLHATLIVVVVLQIPNGWPTILPQVLLVVRVKQLQRLRRMTTNAVVVNAQI